MLWLWQGERAAIARWMERCKARANYSGIADYLDPHYQELMRAAGEEARPAVEAALRS